MNNGWIKIHRKLLEWEWYDEPNTFRLFIHLLLKANHKPKNYRGINIETGQVMTGFSLLAEQTGLTVQKVRTALSNLKSTNEITIKSSNKGTVIQIVKYVDYQVVTSKITNEQQTDNKQTTTNKNVNKEKNEIIIKKKVFNFRKCLIDYGFNDNLIDDWLKVRKTKKASNTQTAFNGFIKQIELSDLDNNDILQKCVENSWSGFNIKWLTNTKENKDDKNKRINELADQIRNRNSIKTGIGS